MEIVFTKADRVGLPENRRYDLNKGILVLRRENEELLSTGKNNASVDYELYENESEIPIYSGSIRLPVQNFNFVEVIKEDYLRYEEMTDDFQDFLIFMSKELGIEEKSKQKAQRKSIKRQTIKKESHQEQPNNAKKSKSIGLVLIGIIACLSLVLNVFLWLKPSENKIVPSANEAVTQRIQSIESIQENQNKIDTFSRFFLSNYYANVDESTFQQKIAPYLDKSEKVHPQKNTLKSILLWTIDKEKGQYKVVYVCTMQNENSQSVVKKVSFNLKAKADSYKVVSQPKEIDFQIVN